MLEKISKLDSQVLRALFVAAAGLIGTIASYFGVSEEVFGRESGRLVDALLLLLSTGGIAWAAYARISKPNPPLSDQALVRTEEMVQEGKLQTRAVRAIRETKK